MEEQEKITITKTIRLEKDLCEKIQELAKENERDFSKQRQAKPEYLVPFSAVKS